MPELRFDERRLFVILAWAIRYAARRAPDFVIGDHQLDRWYVISRNRVFNVYLHRFNASDESRALHDHPWVSLGWILSPQGYTEVTARGARRRFGGSLTLRLPRTAHRVVLCDERPVYTLFLTGPVVRNWGFYCPPPVGWRPWQDFVERTPGGNRAGPGCE